MTHDEIRAAIAASSELRALVPDTFALAAALSAGRVRVAPCDIGIGTVLTVLAPNGGAFLDGMTQLGVIDRNVFWAMELIKQGRFDVGLAGTRSQMQALADAQPQLAPAFNALLSLAEVADPVDEYSVRAAIFADDGALRV